MPGADGRVQATTRLTLECKGPALAILLHLVVGGTALGTCVLQARTGYNVATVAKGLRRLEQLGYAQHLGRYDSWSATLAARQLALPYGEEDGEVEKIDLPAGSPAPGLPAPVDNPVDNSGGRSDGDSPPAQARSKKSTSLVSDQPEVEKIDLATAGAAAVGAQPVDNSAGSPSPSDKSALGRSKKSTSDSRDPPQTPQVGRSINALINTRARDRPEGGAGGNNGADLRAELARRRPPGIAAPADEEEMACSLRLLQDPEIGLGAKSAALLAGLYSFDYLYRQVITFRHKRREGVVTSPGVLLTWCMQNFAPDRIRDADAVGDPLYQRAMDLTEAEALRRLYAPAGLGVET